MPEQSAATIGMALHSMVTGDINLASERLEGLIASDKTGKAEAMAILAMGRALRKK